MKRDLFYFAYGKKNFGYDAKEGEILKVNFDEIDGAGIALIRGKYTDDFGNIIKIKITNHSNNDTYFRVEKKFPYDVKTGFENIHANSSKDITVSLDIDESKNIKELVIALLKEDNTILKTAISIEIIA